MVASAAKTDVTSHFTEDTQVAWNEPRFDVVAKSRRTDMRGLSGRRDDGTAAMLRRDMAGGT
jgi:hypothetical protein